MAQERVEFRLPETLHITNYLALASWVMEVYTPEEARTYRRETSDQKTLERLNQLAASPESASQIVEALNQMLSSLTPREKRVLELRFGTEDGRARTLEEVGRDSNVSRQATYQIEAKALRKLRHPARSRMLRPFFEA